MASALHDQDAGELTEKEWREMRRRMTTLQFEPVPETPELLPRSFYASEDDHMPVKEDSGADALGETVEETPQWRDNSQLQDRLQEKEEKERNAADAVVLCGAPDDRLTVDELRGDADENVRKVLSSGFAPSTRPVKSPTKRSSQSPLKKPRRHSIKSGGKDTIVETDLEVVEATISTAQNELRVTIMTVLRDATSRLERDAQLERRKLSAAHTNRVAILQSEIEELQAQLVSQEHEAQNASQRADRMTRFLMLRKQREREVWRGPRSVHACFRMWKSRWQYKKHKHAQQHVANQFQKKQSQQILLQQWKLMIQQQAWEKKIQALKAEHQQQLDTLKRQHAALVESLQNDLEAVRNEAAIAQHGRKQLEDDLRQVFLRGVSAMNIEALSLFKTNHHIMQQRQQTESVDMPQHQDIVSSSPSEVEGKGMEAPSNLHSANPTKDAEELFGELPSEEHMIPLKQPVTMAEDPRASFLTSPAQVSFPAAAMPSSVIANRLLKRAGSVEMISPPPPPSAAPPPTAAVHGLRSAELVETHQRAIHATSSTPTQPPLTSIMAVSSTPSLRYVPSPAQQRAQAQSSTQFHVEMEYMRSAIETSTLGSRFAIPTSSHSTHRSTPSSSGTLSRSDRPYRSTSSLNVTSTRRSSSFSSPSRSKWRS